MNNKPDNFQNKINNLKVLIKERKKENDLLINQTKKLKLDTSKYQKIFDKSYISMWEEDVSGVYKLLDSLPTETNSQLTEYLSLNPKITSKLIRRIKIIQINDYTVKMFKASSKKELLGSLKSITHTMSFPGFIKLFIALKTKLPFFSYETCANTVEGKKIDILLTAYLPGRGKGNILISMIDITERKIIETNQINNLKFANEQQQRTEIMQSILLSLTSSLDKEKILYTILKEVKRIVPYTCANIRLLEGTDLKTSVAIGYENFGAEDFVKNTTINISDFGDAEIFLESGKISIIQDTQNYTEWASFPKTAFIKGYIGIPIIWDNKSRGLLSLESDTAYSFDSEDAEKLEPFSHAVAVALNSSYLFDLAKKEVYKRVKTEISIKKSLEEKEILLKEIHHRVKNNLSLIMSLINLQSSMLPDNINPLIFEDLKQRVYTISLVHERLYRSKNLSSVDLKSYLIDLTESVRSSSIYKEGIEFSINIEGAIEIEGTILVPLALLLNELLVNSVKYAFPYKPGTISIVVNDNSIHHVIVFRDNGIGLPENRSNDLSQLGLFLVESLVSQINGTVSFKNDGGAVTTISFPKK